MEISVTLVHRCSHVVGRWLLASFLLLCKEILEPYVVATCLKAEEVDGTLSM